MLDEAWVIRECRKNNPKAQETLYKYFALKMMGVCALCRKSGRGEGFVAGWFYKDFTRLDEYTAVGSFEGWMRSDASYYGRNFPFAIREGTTKITRDN